MYARVEFALKRVGRVTDRDGRLIVSWDELAGSISPHFSPTANSRLRDAAAYIFDHPPKKQVLQDGRVEWRVVRSQGRDLTQLLGHIRRIRNNLFHGGKFATDLEAEPARNETLLEHATVVLSEVVNLSRRYDADVYHAFWESIP